MPDTQSNRPVVELSRRRPEFTAEQELGVLREFVIHLMSLNAVPDLCWYVAQEVVGRLGFVDCVVYLFDREKKVLVQEAAIGLKNPEKREITNKLVIPLGKGITGEVARSRKPVLITDAGADPRYIPDVMDGLSEICVPLLHQGEVLGVIDCEDPRKNHFTKYHLETLTAVASIASAHMAQCLLSEKNAAMRKALEVALMESELAQKAQAAFLATVSHELRTPLNAIVGFSSLMSEDVGGSMTPEMTAEYSSYIHQAGQHLTNIVDDILDIAALASSKLQPEKRQLDVAREVKATIEIISCKAADQGIEVEFLAPTNDTSVTFDPRHFKQILVNLLDNAIKYSGDGKRIIIAVDEETEGNVAISVQDFGIGISEANFAEIFQPFRRESAAIDREIQGAGLGLSLVREMAHANGAEVSVTSQLGRGSVFTLTVPSALGCEEAICDTN